MRRPFPFRRRGRNDIDDEHALDADAEYAANEAEYQAWLERCGRLAVHHLGGALESLGREGYCEPDPAYDPDDPFDNERLVPPWERGRL